MDTPRTRLTVSEVADALGVSVRTVRRRIAGGKLSATKDVRDGQELLLIDAAEVGRYADSLGQRVGQQVATPSDVPQAALGQAGADADEVVRLRAALEEQRRALALEQERSAALMRVLENLTQTKALPAPRPDRRPWYAFWRR